MIKLANHHSIAEAAAILNQDGLVGMPTETVYGLAANALNEGAVQKIYAAKGRPAINPLIIHVSGRAQAAQYVEINDAAERLMKALWPGPLTLILPKREDCAICEAASAGLPTLAMRCPSHPVAMALIKQANLPLAAPSANRSGSLSPTTPEHVQKSLGDQVDMILAAGSSEIGLESTVLDLASDIPTILRSGAIFKNTIEDILGIEIASSEGESSDHPKSPGQLLSHYAPSIPLRLNAIDLAEGEALLAFGSDKFMGIKGIGPASNLPETSRMNLSENSDLEEAAANLFKMLHALDHPEHKSIAVMSIPETGIGIAINDRLRRAAASA